MKSTSKFNYKKPSKRTSKKMWIVTASVVLVILIAGGAFAWYRHTHTSNDVAGTNNGSDPYYNPNTFNANPDVPGGTSQPGDNTVASNKDGGSIPTAKTNTGAAPAIPSGAFVSNENVTLSGNRSKVNSVCATTPGASCTIQFTKNGVTKQLPAKTTDGTGHTSWDWTTTDIGLVPGTWTITGVATLGSKSTTYKYPLNLEVSP